jgi:hypothetical protein
MCARLQQRQPLQLLEGERQPVPVVVQAKAVLVEVLMKVLVELLQVQTKAMLVEVLVEV